MKLEAVLAVLMFNSPKACCLTFYYVDSRLTWLCKINNHELMLTTSQELSPILSCPLNTLFMPLLLNKVCTFRCLLSFLTEFFLKV